MSERATEPAAKGAEASDGPRARVAQGTYDAPHTAGPSVIAPCPPSADDATAVLATVERFCNEALAPRCAHPETPLSPRALSSLREQAEVLGLLGSGAEEALGLWEQTQDPATRALSVQILRQLGRHDVAFGYWLHQLGLARALARGLALELPPQTLPVLQGSYGLGRGALPRMLRGLPLEADERALLADYLACDGAHARLVVAADEWQALLLPSFDSESQELGFSVLAREALEVARAEASLGLDALGLFRALRPSGAPYLAHAAANPEHNRDLYARALQLDALGLLALALGALERACELARGYAGMRVQGGVAIARHAAVQDLLGRARSTAHTLCALLESLAALPLCAASLPRVLAARAQAHPACCAAASDALQVFGGLGYMQETGLEKILRDELTLRLLRGAPPDLRRFVAEWERA